MKKQRGIRRKVASTVTVLVVLSLTLLGLALSGLTFINQKSQLLDVQHEILNYAINEISWDIHELEVHLNIAATGNDLMGQDSRKQHDTLSRILTHKDIKSHDILEELILLDRTGKELSRVSRTAVFSDSDLGERSDTREFIIPKESGNIHYGDLMYDKETFEPRITMSMPIQDVRTNEVKGVLIGKIRLNRIWENAVTRSFGETGTIFITNPMGKVVAHPDPSVIYRNTFFNPETPEGLQSGLNSEKVLLVSGKYPLSDQVFTVFTALPFSEVLALSLETLSTTAVFLLIFILLSIAFSYMAANRIVRPIESLADNARSITEGKMVSSIQIGDTDEIGDLSRALNTMTSRLFDNISSLESEIAERKQAEEKIIHQNELLNSVINSLTHPFYVIDANDYTIKIANTAAGFGDLTGKQKCYALTHNVNEPCSSSEHPCAIKKIKETREPVILEHTHYDKAGKPLTVEIHGYPIVNENGKITQVIEYNLDITERRKAEEEIRKFKLLSDNSDDAHFLVKRNTKFQYVNKAACILLGYSEDELLSLGVPDIDTLYDLAKYQELFDLIQKEKTPPIETINRRKDKSTFPSEITVTGHEIGGKPYMFAALRDITERKQAEEKITASLKEKEVLLREIHHRVKNNMQIISSLLNLQSMLLSNKKDIDMLKDSQNRIRAMSLIHEKLYRSESLANINIKEYINDLAKYILQFFEAIAFNVTLKIEADDIFMGIDTAIPCGLIINELMSNSLKHAFPEGRKGEVRITLEKTGDDKIVMTVSNDGISFPEDIDFRKTKSLGLQLVTTLAENQLQGKIELDRSKGTAFRITFKEIKSEQRF